MMHAMYDIWKMKAINELQTLNARRAALKNIPGQIADLESRMAGIRSAALDGTPVKGGGSGGEEAHLNNIVARDDLNASMENTKKSVARIDEALSALTPEENKLLERFYIFPERGAADRLAGEFGIDVKTVYKRNNAALLKFTKAMYGDI